MMRHIHMWSYKCTCMYIWPSLTWIAAVNFDNLLKFNYFYVIANAWPTIQFTIHAELQRKCAASIDQICNQHTNTCTLQKIICLQNIQSPVLSSILRGKILNTCRWYCTCTECYNKIYFCKFLHNVQVLSVIKTFDTFDHEYWSGN